MILFHGSNTEIDKINLDMCKPYKDFGKGFYTTEFEEQAINMAFRTVKQFGGKPIITKYLINDNDFNNPDLKKKKFVNPSNEWAFFVLNNRNKYFKDITNKNCNLDNKYDVIIGPVANDDIRLLFNLFEDEIITIDILRKRLKYKNLTNQISFHTNNAIQYLIKETSYSL